MAKQAPPKDYSQEPDPCRAIHDDSESLFGLNQYGNYPNGDPRQIREFCLCCYGHGGVKNHSKGMKVASLSKHVVYNPSKHAEKVNEQKFYNMICLASLPLVILAQAPESLLNVEWWTTRFGKDYKEAYKEAEIIKYEQDYDPKFKLFRWKQWTYANPNWEKLQEEEAAELERKAKLMRMRESHKACENMSDEDLSGWVEQFDKIQRGESGGAAQRISTEELEMELKKRKAMEEKNEEGSEEEEEEEEEEGAGGDGAEGAVGGDSTKTNGTPECDKKPAAKNQVTSEMVKNREKRRRSAREASKHPATQSTKVMKATKEQGVAAAKAVRESQKKSAANNANNNKRSEEEVEEHIAMAREIMSAKIRTVKRRLTDIHFDWKNSDLNDLGLRLKLIEKKKIKCGEGHLQMILAELNNAV